MNINAPFVRSSRKFPEEAKQLTLEIDRAYIDIANGVNTRTIGIFPSNDSIATGESWYLSGNQKQQTFRKAFTFTTTSTITHGILVPFISQFIRCWGSYTDGTNCYGLIWGTTVAIAGQISFYVTTNQIVFVVGAGAPALTSGIAVLEYLTNV